MGIPLYTNIPSIVGDLLTDVKNGRIGLPDLQRPFVWPDNKVRELLDSMYKEFPIGYIMLWASPEEYTRMNHIGKNNKTYSVPDDLVIDGQQRLTALLAAILGIQIKDKNYNERFIKISFNPLKDDFQVWSPAYERDPEYISAINVLGTPMLFSTVPAFKFMILGSNGTKNSIDKHHIFPKHYLETIGVGNDRDRNQIANFTYLDYQTNINIGEKAPSDYVAEYRAKMGEENYLKTCTENALPPEFEKLDYFTFIEKRRKLMAKIIKKGYKKLCE